MKKSLSRGEKWLLVSPVIIFAAVMLFQAIKQQRGTAFLPTAPSPVQAHFLTNDQILVVTRPLNSHPDTIPSVAIYDRTNGKEMRSRVWKSSISNHASSVSQDGKFWLLFEGLSKSYEYRLVLRDLSTFELIHDFGSNFSRSGWLSDRSFYVTKRKSNELKVWSIQGDGHLTAKKVNAKNLSLPSPDGKWQVEQLPNPLKEIEVGGVLKNRLTSQVSDAPDQLFLASLPERKKVLKLPGDGWQSLTWHNGGEELWGIVFLQNVYPGRYDIVHLNMASRTMSSVKLEPKEEVTGEGQFVFSPDRKLLALGHRNNSVYLWETATGKFLKTYTYPQKVTKTFWYAPKFSADGKYLMTLHPQGIEFYRVDQLLKP